MDPIQIGAGVAVGMVLGGVVSYFVTKKKYEAILAEEIQSVKDFYDVERNHLTRTIKRTQEKLDIVEERDQLVRDAQEVEETMLQQQRIIDDGGYRRYHDAFIVPESSEPEKKIVLDVPVLEFEDDDSWANEPEIEVTIQEEDGPRFELLQFDSYLIEMDEREHALLIYSPATGMLRTEDDEVINNKLSVIGQEALNAILKKEYSGDSLYVLNRNRNTVYEVYVADE